MTDGALGSVSEILSREEIKDQVPYLRVILQGVDIEICIRHSGNMEENISRTVAEVVSVFPGAKIHKVNILPPEKIEETEVVETKTTLGLGAERLSEHALARYEIKKGPLKGTQLRNVNMEELLRRTYSMPKSFTEEDIAAIREYAKHSKKPSLITKELQEKTNYVPLANDNLPGESVIVKKKSSRDCPW